MKRKGRLGSLGICWRVDVDARCQRSKGQFQTLWMMAKLPLRMMASGRQSAKSTSRYAVNGRIARRPLQKSDGKKHSKNKTRAMRME